MAWLLPPDCIKAPISPVDDIPENPVHGKISKEEFVYSVMLGCLLITLYL